MEPDSDIIAYVEGAIEKCAEYGVDPQVIVVEIIKNAQQAQPVPYEDVGYNLRKRVSDWFMGMKPVKSIYNTFFRPSTYMEGTADPAYAQQQRRAAWDRARYNNPELRYAEQAANQGQQGAQQQQGRAWQPPLLSQQQRPPQPPQPPQPGNTR